MAGRGCDSEAIPRGCLEPWVTKNTYIHGLLLLCPWLLGVLLLVLPHDDRRGRFGVRASLVRKFASAASGRRSRVVVLGSGYVSGPAVSEYKSHHLVE